MIQFKRGSTKSWLTNPKPLAAGQPGYDKKKHKIKIGDGESPWALLPDASGLSSKEILNSEKNAKVINRLDKEDETIITYGTEAPDENTVGKIYLQYYDTKPETDYIVSSGIDGIWTYQIWKSGSAHCWGIQPLTTAIQSAVGNGTLFINNTVMKKVNYPFTFAEPPVETATLSGAKGKVSWLASQDTNSTKTSGLYSILSYDKQISTDYGIVLSVKGKIKK